MQVVVVVDDDAFIDTHQLKQPIRLMADVRIFIVVGLVFVERAWTQTAPSGYPTDRTDGTILLGGQHICSRCVPVSDVFGHIATSFDEFFLKSGRFGNHLATILMFLICMPFIKITNGAITAPIGMRIKIVAK